MRNEIAIESVRFDSSIYLTVNLDESIDALFSFSPDRMLLQVQPHVDNDDKMDVGGSFNYIKVFFYFFF